MPWERVEEGGWKFPQHDLILSNSMSLGQLKASAPTRHARGGEAAAHLISEAEGRWAAPAGGPSAVLRASFSAHRDPQGCCSGHPPFTDRETEVQGACDRPTVMQLRSEELGLNRSSRRHSQRGRCPGWALAPGAPGVPVGRRVPGSGWSQTLLNVHDPPRGSPARKNCPACVSPD